MKGALLLAAAVAANTRVAGAAANATASETDVMAIYFGDWHVNEDMTYLHGPNWTEWGMVTHATPRYPGHLQPNLPHTEPPGWGIGSAENTAAGMQVKIEAALEAGVDVMMFDWYWYAEKGTAPDGKGGGFLNGALEDGFLKLTDTKMKFSLMWANQDWVDVHPAKRGWHSTGRVAPTPGTQPVYPGEKPRGVDGRVNMLLQYDGFMNRSVYTAAFRYAVDNYFVAPNYYKVPTKLRNGTTAQCAYYAIYQMNYLLDGVGGLEAGTDLFDAFRDYAEARGTCLHLVDMVAGSPNAAYFAKSKALGVSSATSYCWMKVIGAYYDLVFPETNYTELLQPSIQAATNLTEAFATELGIPYAPVISVAWDSTPRTLPSDAFGQFGYPWGPSYHSTPDTWGDAVSAYAQFTKQQCDANKAAGLWCPPLLINAWNEWSEGSYLEPDVRYGMQKLQALGKTFGGRR